MSSPIARLAHAALFAALFGATACDLDPTPLPSDVHVIVGELGDLEIGALRVAVVWTLEGEGPSALEVTHDVAAEPGDTVAFSVALPSPDVVERLDPVEDLFIDLTLSDAIYRPRVLAYDDVDGDGRLDPDAFGIDGPDRVLAADAGQIAAILDLDHFLSLRSLPGTADFYAKTGDRYTPIVTVRQATNIELSDAPLVVPLSLNAPEQAQTSFACRRDATTSAESFVGDLLEVTAAVDTSLDPAAVCGLWVSDCRGTDLDAIAPPALTSEQGTRVAQCRSSGALEALIVRQIDLICENCSCSTVADDVVYVADPADLPGWWPCGTELERCESSLPLFLLEPSCAR